MNYGNYNSLKSCIVCNLFNFRIVYFVYFLYNIDLRTQFHSSTQFKLKLQLNRRVSVQLERCKRRRAHCAIQRSSGAAHSAAQLNFLVELSLNCGVVINWWQHV